MNTSFPVSRVQSRWTDSNRRPADYKSAALPAELHRHYCFPAGLPNNLLLKNQKISC
jgi:hypothetical protein